MIPLGAVQADITDYFGVSLIYDLLNEQHRMPQPAPC